MPTPFQIVQNQISQAVLKTLLIIGYKDSVEKCLRETSGVEGLDIVGLVVSQAHDSYKMSVKPASSTQTLGPFFFVCDRVAKSLQPDNHGNYHVISAQRLSDLGKRGLDTSTSPSAPSLNEVVPPGWIFFRDPISGNDYYANPATGRFSLERPVETIPPPPPAASPPSSL